MQYLLVIDDNPLVLRLCQMVLSKSGFRLVLAQTAIQALKALEQNSAISALLVDSALTSPSTEEILQAMENRPNLRNLPVVLLVPKGGKVSHTCMRFPAVCKVLEKPFSPSLLLQAAFGVLKRGCQEHIDARRLKMAAGPVETPAPLQPPVTPVNAFQPLEQPGSPALVGQIEIMPLAEVFQLLHFQNQTGAFEVTKGEQQISIYFEDGVIQFAHSRNLRKEFWLGRVLVQENLLNVQQVEELLRKKSPLNLPLGEYLLSLEQIQPDSLKFALSRQTSLLIYELLRWKEGRFAFRAMKTLPHLVKKADLQLPVDGLLLEGYRRLDEWKMLETELGSFRSIWERTAQSKAALDHLSGMERDILSEIDGVSTLEQLTDRLALGSFDCLKVFRDLVARKMVQQRNLGSGAQTFDA